MKVESSRKNRSRFPESRGALDEVDGQDARTERWWFSTAQACQGELGSFGAKSQFINCYGRQWRLGKFGKLHVVEAHE